MYNKRQAKLAKKNFLTRNYYRVKKSTAEMSTGNTKEKTTQVQSYQVFDLAWNSLSTHG